MSLYHLMADIGAVPSKVIPKIPANAMKEEDQSIPRICVSRSLDECLTGITVTGITFPFLLEELRTSHTKQIWDKQYQFPFIVRTYCVENNNSAFFDEKKFPNMFGMQILRVNAGWQNTGSQSQRKNAGWSTLTLKIDTLSAIMKAGDTRLSIILSGQMYLLTSIPNFKINFCRWPKFGWSRINTHFLEVCHE